MLYDGAVKFLQKALDAMAKGDDAEKGRQIVKAMAVVTELDSSLNMEAGGEIAANLRALYDFIHRHLFEANVERNADKVRQVIGILDELNKGWRAITS